MGPGPLGNLLALDILEAPLVETDADGGMKPLLLVVVGEIAQLLELELVALALVDVGERGLALLGRNAGRSIENVLETEKKDKTWKLFSSHVKSLRSKSSSQLCILKT